jgi:hypothetical protein
LGTSLADDRSTEAEGTLTYDFQISILIKLSYHDVLFLALVFILECSFLYFLTGLVEGSSWSI